MMGMVDMISIANQLYGLIKQTLKKIIFSLLIVFLSINMTCLILYVLIFIYSYYFVNWIIIIIA